MLPFQYTLMKSSLRELINSRFTEKRKDFRELKKTWNGFVRIEIHRAISALRLQKMSTFHNVTRRDGKLHSRLEQ